MTVSIQNDNSVTIFQLEDSAVRGRSVYLSSALNEALGERYPEEVAGLLGQAMMIGSLVARSLKFKGRLIVQCHGTNEGAVSLLMADCTTEGHIRGYARWDDEQLKTIRLDNRNPGAKALLGGGTFSMTIDQGPDMDQYQGLSAIEGDSLSECAEHFFKQSEQIPTRIKLACARQITGEDAESWLGGGLMIQKVASDEARGDTEADWETANALFETISDEELLDPTVTQDTLLYRLFHEGGVRVEARETVEAKCKCSEERLLNTLKSFDPNALTDMAKDGEIIANCEFCGSTYKFQLDQIVQ